MPILFTGRKADLTRALKEYAEEKLAKLDRFLGDSPDIHLILSREKHRHLVEIVARTRAATLTARADGSDFHESIGLCLERVLTQARKHRSRFSRERKRRAMQRSPRGAGPERTAPPPSEAAIADDERPVLVPMGRVPVKPMSVEEALFQMQESPDPFLVFRNSESQQVSVIFRRRDGRFGLIEPEA